MEKEKTNKNKSDTSIKEKPGTLVSEVQKDEITDQVMKEFTIQTNKIEFVLHDDLPVQDFRIGLIVGTSGSGKSLLLEKYRKNETITDWDNRAICSHFKDYEDSKNRLLGVGLCSIPSWLLSYDKLSTGQKYRADTARNLYSGSVFDEFTSVIDRDTAKGLAKSLNRYIIENNLKNIIFAGPHFDIIPFLKPDWIYCTDTREFYTDDIKPDNNIILEINI